MKLYSSGARAQCLAMGLVLLSFSPASSECDPIDFMVQDVQHITVSDEVEIAFLMTATKEQFDSARKSMGAGGAFGRISGNANYGEAKQRAVKEAKATKFDYSRSYYINFLSRQLSPRAAQMYSDCLEKDKERPGLRLWFSKQEGEFFFLKAFWVGGVEVDGIGRYDDEPVLEQLTLVRKPGVWPKGKTQEILVKKARDVDALISLSVGGQTKSLVLPKEPPRIVMQSRAITSGKTMKAASTRRSKTVCPSGTDSDCIIPQNPNGSLVPGSGGVTDLQSLDARMASYKVTTDTPERICITFTVATGACEFRNEGSARLVATERFPVSQER
jgi:hypothetical protein